MCEGPQGGVLSPLLWLCLAMAEVNIRSFSSLAGKQGAILRERVLRLPHNVPARQTVTRKTKKQLLNRQTWREEATKIAEEALLEETEREAMSLSLCPPWLAMGKGRITFHTETGDTTSRHDPRERRQAAAERVLESLPPSDSTYFTDGSTEKVFGVGGGGFCMEQSRGIATWSVPAGKWASSYRAEQVAFLAAVEDAVPTESLTRPESLTKIWTGLSNLSRRKKNAQIVWIPGHADIAGNEQADQAANTGRTLPQETARIDLPSAKVAIHGVCWKKWSGTYRTTVPPEHTHRRATDGRCLKYESEWSRRDQVLLHQLRADRFPLLQAKPLWPDGTGPTSTACARVWRAERHGACRLRLPKVAGGAVCAPRPHPDADSTTERPGHGAEVHAADWHPSGVLVIGSPNRRTAQRKKKMCLTWTNST